MSAIAVDEFTSLEAWRATLAEFVATLLFVFIGAGSVVATGALTNGELTAARLLVIALAHGFAIAIGPHRLSDGGVPFWLSWPWRWWGGHRSGATEYIRWAHQPGRYISAPAAWLTVAEGSQGTQLPFQRPEPTSGARRNPYRRNRDGSEYYRSMLLAHPGGCSRRSPVARSLRRRKARPGRLADAADTGWCGKCCPGNRANRVAAVA